jgi:hypothetical protein
LFDLTVRTYTVIVMMMSLKVILGAPGEQMWLVTSFRGDAAPQFAQKSLLAPNIFPLKVLSLS